MAAAGGRGMPRRGLPRDEVAAGELEPRSTTHRYATRSRAAAAVTTEAADPSFHTAAAAASSSLLLSAKGSQALQDRRLVVGCLLSDKKQRHLDFPVLQSAARRHNVDMVVLDSSRPLAGQLAAPASAGAAPLDILLHKVTDELCSPNSPASQRTLAVIEEYAAAHPTTLIVDPIASVQLLSDRAQTCRMLANTVLTSRTSGRSIRTPPFVVLDAAPLPQQHAAAAALAFPLICKNVIAHGSDAAHHMVLVFNRSGLARIRPPAVVQEFKSHSAVLFKIFVVGDQHYSILRPSIRNMEPSSVDDNISFSSRKVSKPDSATTLNDEAWRDPANIPVLDEGLVTEYVALLRAKLNLSLFGIDVIVEGGTGEHYAVDINYFPGYAGVPLPDIFPAFLRNLAKTSTAVS